MVVTAYDRGIAYGAALGAIWRRTNSKEVVDMGFRP